MKFNYVNEPEPKFEIRPVGEDSETETTVDCEQRGNPSPENFHAIGTAEVKLVVAMSDFEDDDVIEAAEKAHDALHELKEAMADARGITDEPERSNLLLGNVDELPECTSD